MKDFTLWLHEALQIYPESETLKVWNARLAYLQKPEPREKQGRKTVILVFVSFMACVLVKMNAILHLDTQWFMSRFFPLIVIGTMAVYFSLTEFRHRNRFSLYGFAGCLVLLLLLPDGKHSASVTMALIHMPLVFLSLLALTFMGHGWMKPDSRILFIRYLGEVLIYTAIILLGGMILTGITIGLFSLIKVNIGNWYSEYIVVFGLTTAPLVATYLFDVSTERKSRIAVIIAHIFSPLFLVTVIVYLVVIIAKGRSPYSDREFLITINGLLLLVLAITVYSICGKDDTKNQRLQDVISIGLVSTTLVINLLALSAMVFRWAEYGVTPNRVAVTGTNILIFIHLVLILKTYAAHAVKRCPVQALLVTVSGFLPIYTAWSVLMAAALPLVFNFK